MEEASIPRRVVEIYSKPACSLCDLALHALLAVQKRIPFELVEHDIRADAALAEAWRYDIPVVCIDGVVAFRGRVSEDALERRLLQPGVAEGPSGTG